MIYADMTGFDWFGILAPLIVVSVLIGIFARRKKRPSVMVRVTADEAGIAVFGKGKPVARIAWSDIRRVTVIRTRKGAWRDDRFFHIVHASGEVTIPSKATGADAFMTRLSERSGFDERAYVAIAETARDDSFVVLYTLKEATHEA